METTDTPIVSSTALHFPSLDAIWCASEEAARAGLDPPALRLSAPWRLLLLSPTSLELSLNLIAREPAQPRLIESGEIINVSTAPAEVKAQLSGAVLRTQHALVDSTGRALAYSTTWSAECEFQSGEGATPKAVMKIIYGHCSSLELLFKEAGPLWGRIIGNKSAVSYEVFSPHLATFIGTPAMKPPSTNVSHLHAEREQVALSQGDVHELPASV